MPICDVPFVLRSNKPCSKQSSCQWFGMCLRSCDNTIMTIPQSTILWMADSHLGIRNSVSKWLCPSYTELMWFYCNDNAAKWDFESQTAYSQFGIDIVIRSGIIHYKWPNLKRESLNASIIWFWTNSQGTGDWDVMYYFAINPSCFGNAWREGRHFYFHVPRKMRDIGDNVPEIVKITLLRFRYQWPKDPMNDKSETVSQSQGRQKHANGERKWYQ